MNNGIYLLMFKSKNMEFGTGILVVNHNVLNGGDIIYSYSGSIKDNEVIIDLIKHNSEVNSFFGNFGKLRLNLLCNPEPQGYLLKGQVQNLQTVPLVIKAKFIGHFNETIDASE